MKISTLLDAIATAVANDAAIEAFCQTNFNKSVNVYVHIDPKNPPRTSEAPWVGLTTQGYNRPTENNVVSLEFDLESAAYCAKNGATVSGKITTLKGFETLEDFSDLVFAAIETAVSTSDTQLEMTYRDEQGTGLGITELSDWIASRTWTISKRI